MHTGSLTRAPTYTHINVHSGRSRSWLVHGQYKLVLIMPWYTEEKFHMLTSSNGNISRVDDEFPSQRPVTRSFDVFFDLRLNKRSSKQPWEWWLQMLLRPLWRYCNELERHCHEAPGGRFKNAYELLNLRALKISMLYKNRIFQCMSKIFCVEFQRVPLKFHTKYLTHTLKDMIFYAILKF